MSEKNRHAAISSVLAIVAGAVAGFGASFAAARPVNAVPVPAPSALYVRAEGAPAVAPAADPRIGDLQQRLAMVEARSAAPPSTSANAVPGAPDRARAPTHEQLHQHVDEHAKAVADHAREPTDPSWSRGANASLTANLDAVAKTSGFRVVDVDCRTTTCLGTVEWPSFDAAQRGYAAILHEGYDMSCSRKILLEDPKDPSAPYRATAVFDCESARIASVQ